MSTSYPDSRGVVDIQTRLNQHLIAWYPDMAGSNSLLVFRGERVYRWSRHLLYEISCDHNQPAAGILVKQPQLRDPGGRSQFEALTGQNPLFQEFRALSLIYEHFQGSDVEDITAVRPLAHFPDLNALVLEYLPGQHLLSLLLTAGVKWAKPSVVQQERIPLLPFQLGPEFYMACS